MPTPSPSGARGTRVFMTATAIADTVDTEREFTALTWVEIGGIGNLGEIGTAFEAVSHIALDTGRTRKFKGAFDGGTLELKVAMDLSDAGQLALKAAAEGLSQSNYGFRIEWTDAPSSVGGPSMLFFAGMPMMYRADGGNASSVLTATARVEVNADEVIARAAQLYDRFNTGGSLSGYARFAGSDAQATSPAISSDTLVCATGNDGSGFAADGSQAIHTTAIQLAGITQTIVEARIKSNSATAEAIFFGLTDQVAALEIPIESAASADTITTNATDAVGFMYDTAMATDMIWLVGVNNNVDETAQNSGLAIVADTYRTLRLELDSVGNAAFYIDGVQVGSAMTTACRTSVNLYPTIAAGARSTSLRTITVDYLYVRQYVASP